MVPLRRACGNGVLLDGRMDGCDERAVGWGGAEWSMGWRKVVDAYTMYLLEVDSVCPGHPSLDVDG